MEIKEQRNLSLKDLTGEVFGKLTVTSFSEHKGTHYYWNCICECGNVSTPERYSLSSGKSKSCGCDNISKLIVANTSHGQSGTRFYKIWQGMKKRCMNPKATSYKFYGAKGVKVCDRWISYENFAEDMQKGYNDTLTLDRIDGTKDYTPENCRWVSMSVQDYNKPMSDRNTSGCVGVYFDAKANKWRAYIGVEKQRINLGSFDNLNCAVEARKQAEIKHYGSSTLRRN